MAAEKETTTSETAGASAANREQLREAMEWAENMAGHRERNLADETLPRYPNNRPIWRKELRCFKALEAAGRELLARDEADDTSEAASRAERIDKLYAELRRLQQEEAVEHRREFEASLSAPIGAGRELLEKVRRTLDEQQATASEPRDEAKGDTRKLDGKFHVAGGEIVKTTSGELIPHDEPLLLLRGRDRLALPTIEHYATLCRLDGCNDWQMEGINGEIARFRAFIDEHPERMKQPGITKGAAWKGEQPAPAPPVEPSAEVASGAISETAVENARMRLLGMLDRYYTPEFNPLNGPGQKVPIGPSGWYVERDVLRALLGGTTK